jgi:predicted DNA-binding transcriptional regulator AlpA
MTAGGDAAEPLHTRFLRLKEVSHRLRVSKDTLRRIRERDATFPGAVRISPGVELIAEHELDRWMRERKQDSLDHEAA